MPSTMNRGALAAGLITLFLVGCDTGAPTQAQSTGQLQQAGIASAHPLATQAGLDILSAGGNAFDAAVAVAAALSVVEPYSSGVGGGGFFLLHLAEENRDVFVDAREVAPGAATPDMYLDDQGELIPRASVLGPLAAGIPGQPAGLVHLAERYGRLPLAQSLAPAIQLAEEGFPVYSRMLGGLRFMSRAFTKFPAFGEIFMPGGEIPEEGYILRQPDLAAIFVRLASEGADGFYRGETAQLLVEGVREAGGIWTLEDLENYRVVERDPIRGTYRGMEIISAPPPSAGGIGLVQMFNVLSGYPMDSLSGGLRKHLIVEAMRRAYRDRGEFMGDPDFIEVPVQRLTDPDYAAGQRSSISPDRATVSDSLPSVYAPPMGDHTTHFSIIDREGNRVGGTLSINTWFGSGFVPPGTGVILNNEMDDFTTKPGVPNEFELVAGEANAVRPGRRMVSSMSPTFLVSDRGVAVVGTPGGSRIITMNFLAAMEWLAGGSAEDMVSRRRFHHQYLPDEVSFETGALTEEEIADLKKRGHKLRESRRDFGNMNVVTWDAETGAVEAANDPRGGGEGRVY